MFQPVTPSAPPPGTPNGTKKTVTIVLSTLVVVFTLAAGLFLFLFLSERGAVADTNSEVTNTEQQLKDQKGKLSDTKSEAADLEQKGQDLQDTHDKYQACSDAAKAALAAAGGSEAELKAAVDKMVDTCPEELGNAT